MSVEISIPASIVTLAKYFPSGFDSARGRLYEEDLARRDCQPQDVAEAVERIKATRESRAYPSISELIRHTREAQSDRLRAPSDDPALLHAGMRPFTSSDRREGRVWRDLALVGVTYCDDRGWRLGEPCACNASRPVGVDFTCWGEGVSLQEAEAKLVWAQEHRDEIPASPVAKNNWSGARGYALGSVTGLTGADVAKWKAEQENP